jgi:hypothetical protein
MVGIVRRGIERARRFSRRALGRQESSIRAATARRPGTFRTVCVRTCDGYYFPISYSTVPNRFTDDQNTCHAC